ncbi:MAG: ABC transporter substrate-binding protein [bacterium]
MKNKKLIFGIVIVLVVVILLAYGQNSKNNEIRIGLISPLTGSAAAYGEPAMKSALIAQDEINQNGGILGKKVKLIVEDGKCDGTAAASAANKLISIDKVSIILGGHCSTETLAIAPIVEKAKVVTIASITSSPAVTNAGDYIFRNSPSSEFYTAKSADYAYSKGYRKVAALYENKDFPVGVYQAFLKEFTKLGGQVISNDPFNSDVNDLRSDMIKIDKEKPDAILFASQGPGASVTFYKQMQELGLLSKYPIIAGAQSISPIINQQTNGLLNNPNIFTTDAVFDPKNAKSEAFLSRYQSIYKQLPPTNIAYLATSYDAVYLAKEAIESCKSYTDTACIRDYLGSLKDWSGATGILTLGKIGDPVTPIGLHFFDASGQEKYQELK